MKLSVSSILCLRLLIFDIYLYTHIRQKNGEMRVVLPTKGYVKNCTCFIKKNYKSVQACANEALSQDIPHDTVNLIQNLDALG